MPPQELIRKWKINKGKTTHVKRKSPLHGKIIFNNHFIVVKILSTHVSTEGSSSGGN
jgi:hypothetical protein